MSERNGGAATSWLDAAIARLEPEKMSVAVLGSHSALEVARGAKAQGLPERVVAQRGRIGRMRSTSRRISRRIRGASTRRSWWSSFVMCWTRAFRRS